jgi:NADH:ubiquinone oxidoreductase subunit K
MNKHITIVAALRIGSAAMWFLIAGIILLLLIGPGLIAQCVDGDAEALVILTAIAFPLAFFFTLSAVLNLIGGIGILKHKNWARYLVMVLSVLDLFNIPIGTALGIYCLWALAHDETARIFTMPAAA